MCRRWWQGGVWLGCCRALTGWSARMSCLLCLLHRQTSSTAVLHLEHAQWGGWRLGACARHRAVFEGGLLQGFDWLAWSVVGLQVPPPPQAPRSVLCRRWQKIAACWPAPARHGMSYEVQVMASEQKGSVFIIPIARLKQDPFYESRSHGTLGLF